MFSSGSLVVSTFTFRSKIDLQEVPVGNTDFLWFTDLKGDTGKYCAGYAITIPFPVFEAASLPMFTTAQQACTLAKAKFQYLY